MNNLERTVILVGHAESCRLDEYYQLADIFIVPTSPGTTLLEAMSFEKPFILFTSTEDPPAGTSVAELEKRRLGIILKNSSIDVVANELLKIVDDLDWRVKMGAQCREYVSSELNWEKVARKMIRVYEEVMELRH